MKSAMIDYSMKAISTVLFVLSQGDFQLAICIDKWYYMTILMSSECLRKKRLLKEALEIWDDS